MRAWDDDVGIDVGFVPTSSTGAYLICVAKRAIGSSVGIARRRLQYGTRFNGEKFYL